MRAPDLSEDLFAPGVLDDPYPLYDRLRAAGPVHRLPGPGLYLVVRHAEVIEALDDHETFSSNLAALLYTGKDGVALVDGASTGTDALATADPPAHTGQRRIVQGTFGAGRVRDMHADVAAIVTPRVAALAAAGGGDWMSAVAAPVPVLMIGRVLGLPEDDADRHTAWSDAAVELLSGVADGERMGELAVSILEFMAYLRAHLEGARRHPTGGLIDEVAGAWAGGDLSADEATSILLQLVTAGSESTTSLIGSAARMLAADAGLQERVRRDPALLDAFVEEVLRLESPFRGHFRVTTRAAVLGGVDIPARARVMLLWGAANRDPEAFADPATLDLARRSPKAHTAFGRGLHFCVGAHLARLEAAVALRALLDATTSFTLAPAEGDGPDDGTGTDDTGTRTGAGGRRREPGYVRSMLVRRLARLPLVLLAAGG